MKCPRCQHANRLKAKVCRKCGSRLKAVRSTAPTQADLTFEVEQLRRALSEALEQQTATSEILSIIRSSPSNLQPVLDTVAERAARLCGANDAIIYRVDGDVRRRAAHFGSVPITVAAEVPLNLGSVTGRAILEHRTIHVHDVFEEFARGEYADSRQRQGDITFRTVLVTPLLREGVAVGAITIRRLEVRPFTDNQIKLLQTFADQAVIAIENARLFRELETRNRDLTESLEQQTATSEILRVISRSPTELQPVFDAIVQSAVKLCGALRGNVQRFDGELLHLVAAHNYPREIQDVAQRSYPMRPSRSRAAGRVALTGAVAHVPDALEDPEYDPSAVRGLRSLLAVPMLRDGNPIGVISVGRAVAGPFSINQIELLKTFADQGVIAIENMRLFTELQEKNRALTQAHATVTEALDQQTATSDVLKVISSSQTDVQPVFEAIVRSAAALCHAPDVLISITDGDSLRVAASVGPVAASVQTSQVFQDGRLPRTRGFVAGRAFIDRCTVHIHDVGAMPDDEFPEGKALQRAYGGHGTTLAVPLLRDNVSVGVITLLRNEVSPFSDQLIKLLETFADQAVIAIENVRLFTELQDKNRALTAAHAQVTESLEQQTATSEILRAIAQARTEVQPVFDTIVRSAARLLHAAVAAVFLTDGRTVHVPANYGSSAEALATVRAGFPRLLDMETTAGMAILTRSVVHVPDTEDPSISEHVRQIGRMLGFRGLVTVPMLREDEVVGAISVDRREPGRFSDAEVSLLQTFADQAVIAIENVRLFTELQDKNRALTAAHAQVTESLEQQTATSEILRVISAVHTDAQPVFDTIVRSAVRLCKAATAAVFLTDGRMLYEPANYGDSPERLAAARARYPRPLDMDTAGGIAILTRSVVHVPDTEDPSAIEWIRQSGRLVGFRSVVTVPMLREGEAIGAILVTRRQPGPFSDTEVELLKTFTDQAVIAIENVRLFKELEARTQDLTRSVGELRALGEVGQAISSTLDLETVLNTIVARAVQLSGLDGGVVFEYDEAAEEFVQRAMTDTSGALAEARRTTRIRKGEGVLGRTAITLEPVQVADIALPGAYEGRLREILIDSGVRAILAVPMVREGQLIGCLAVTRNLPGDFPGETIDLLRTFATQSALAIQNARLFREIEIKSRQLEAASRHKSEFLANMSHELRTPLNAIIGFSEVLNERMFGELNEKQDEYLKDIYASGQHLLSLINDILDLSKIEAGRMELELADFSLPAAIDNALTLVRERASRHGIRLGGAIDDRVGMIRGDERKVRQVLLNLLSNALKFTPEGGRIDVRATMNEGMAEISVTDTGVGIAPEDQEAIFEEFRQVGTADKKVEGTGLGLALSRKFIELHGGRIWVESEVGKGSTFRFTLSIT